MRKLLLSIIGVLVGCSLVFASPVKIQVIDTLLDDSPTSATGTRNTGSYKRVAVFVDYNETEVGETLSATVTLDVSHDGSNWIDTSFYDVAGNTTLQTSETLSADSNYVMWLDSDWYHPYIRLSVAGVNVDSDDTIDIDGFISGLK